MLKLLGFFFLLAGALLVFTAIVLLGARSLLPFFAIAGLVLEVAGLLMTARAFAAPLRSAAK